MIDLTPLEVRQKKGDFRRVLRGYDRELVNDFLDLVADRMEELVKENMALGDSVRALETEVVQYREKERALSDALMAAERLRKDAKAHAEREGELMIREARLAAEAARDEVARALAREEDALRQARARRGQLVASFRRLLEREMSELAALEEALELEAPEEEAGAASASAAADERPEPEPGPEPEPDAPAGRAGREGAEEGRTGRRGGARRAAATEPEPAAEVEDVQEDWLSSLVEE